MHKSQENQRDYDPTELLQNFKLNTTEDWAHWDFKHSEYEHIPLGFYSRYNFYKSAKYCNLATIAPKQEDLDYMVVEGNVKKKNKQHISKNVKLNDRRQPGNTNIRVMTKKFMRNLKPWHNQIKTNFKKITVKNDWKEVKTINRTILDALPKETPMTVKHLKTVGKVHYILPQVERISWQPIKFKENKVYEVEPVSTADDSILTKIVLKLMEKQSNRYNIITHPNFLLTLLTIRGGVYPWNIEIEKDGNNIVLQSYKGSEDAKELNYLDLFVVNENTTNNMPIDEAVVKKNCVTATKMTKVFKDLLASGELAEDIEIQSDDELFQESEEKEEKAQGEEEGQGEQEQGQEEEEEEEEEDYSTLQKLRKYLKISLGNIDVYSYVEIDGAKKKQSTGEIEQFLIRTFMESETQGAWVKDMKVSTGTIITKEYHSNNCSMQKWICQAKLAGVSSIKTGFMGFEQNKPVLLNVNEITVEGMESILSFKTESCWSVLKYIGDLLVGLEDGTYVLSRAPYTPLSIKLFKIASKEEEDEEFEEEDEKQKDASQE